MKRRNGLGKIMVRDYLANIGLSNFTNKPIAKSDGNIVEATIKYMLATYKNDFASELSTLLAPSGLQKLFKQLSPKLSASILMYQDLASLSLNYYLSK